MLTDRIPQSRLGAWFVISIPCDACILALAIDPCSQLALADDAGNARGPVVARTPWQSIYLGAPLALAAAWRWSASRTSSAMQIARQVMLRTEGWFNVEPARRTWTASKSKSHVLR